MVECDHFAAMSKDGDSRRRANGSLGRSDEVRVWRTSDVAYWAK